MKKTIHSLIAISALSHVFCCVLPALVALTSLVTVVPILSQSVPYLDYTHGLIHDYELILMVFSALLLGLGWGLELSHERYNKQIQCVNNNRTHRKIRWLLWAATIIFIVNSMIFMTTHFQIIGKDCAICP